MHDAPDEFKVRFARRFVAHHPDQGDIHGVEFPPGRILADVPGIGLTAYLDRDALTEGRDDVVVHWADEQPPAPGCPHCPDGHTPPDHGQPWSAWVAAERDGDGQPAQIIVARSAGAHVSESDAQWIRDRLNGRATGEPTNPRTAGRRFPITTHPYRGEGHAAPCTAEGYGTACGADEYNHEPAAGPGSEDGQ